MKDLRLTIFHFFTSFFVRKNLHNVFAFAIQDKWNCLDVNSKEMIIEQWIGFSKFYPSLIGITAKFKIEFLNRVLKSSFRQPKVACFG